MSRNCSEKQHGECSNCAVHSPPLRTNKTGTSSCNFRVLPALSAPFPPLHIHKISGIEVVTPEATNILVWFGSLYVFISP